MTVAPLTVEQIGQLKPGAVVIGFMQAHARKDEVKALRDRKITSFAVELIFDVIMGAIELGIPYLSKRADSP